MSNSNALKIEINIDNFNFFDKADIIKIINDNIKKITITDDNIDCVLNINYKAILEFYIKNSYYLNIDFKNFISDFYFANELYDV